MDSHLALVIDDEPDILELLEITLSRMDVECKTAADISSAKKLLERHEFDICLTDMKLPDGDGLEFISYFQEKLPQVPIAIITAHGSIETAINALKLGAFDFLTKPIDLQRLRMLIENALKLSAGKSVLGYRLIGKSDQIKDLRKVVSKLARSEAPIYISGESGVGKELVARMIHEQGARANAAFIPVNCGAIPPELMESEFFGHLKGSFTGAVSDKKGLFQAADGGTLFLDEVAELPQNMQVKLLRAIQEKSIRPIGSQTEQNVDVRILSATHKNLPTMVESGQFRQDLFYRINVIELPVVPLRNRKVDIPLLVEYIIDKLTPVGSTTLAGPITTGRIHLTDAAISELMDYSFPGNIRELENIIQRAMALCESDEIDSSDLQLPEKTDINPAGPTDNSALDSFLADKEKERILQALEKTRWNKTAAAKVLGISFRALRYRLEKLGID